MGKLFLEGGAIAPNAALSYVTNVTHMRENMNICRIIYIYILVKLYGKR